MMNNKTVKRMTTTTAPISPFPSLLVVTTSLFFIFTVFKNPVYPACMSISVQSCTKYLAGVCRVYQIYMRYKTKERHSRSYMMAAIPTVLLLLGLAAIVGNAQAWDGHEWWNNGNGGIGGPGGGCEN